MIFSGGCLSKHNTPRELVAKDHHLEIELVATTQYRRTCSVQHFLHVADRRAAHCEQLQESLNHKALTQPTEEVRIHHRSLVNLLIISCLTCHSQTSHDILCDVSCIELLTPEPQTRNPTNRFGQRRPKPQTPNTKP